MRIVTTLSYYAPHWTGLTVYAQRIAEGLAARGHDVTVVTTRHADDLPSSEVIGGVTVERLATVGRVSRAMLAPRLLPTLWHRLGDADLLHVHSPMPEAGAAVAIARQRGVATMVTHQGDVVMPAGAGNRLIQAAMNISLGHAVAVADAVVTHGDDYAGESRLLARRAGAATGAVAGINPPTTIPTPDVAAVAALRTSLGAGAAPGRGTRLVGFAGRFVEEKGFDLLLEAMPTVVEAIGDVRFVFAGETDVAYEDFAGSCRPLLAANADHLTSLGLLRDRQQLADFYGACDLFVLPSRSDCFAAVQVEALLCGAPVVATDIPGAREVIERSGFGRLVRPGEPAALAAGIVAELSAPRPRPVRDTVAAHFDPEHALDRYEELAIAARESRRRAPRARPTPVAGPVGAGLAAADRATLDALLVNETDVAFRRRARRAIELLDLRDGERVLDAGCGMGVLSMLIAAVRRVELLAVDRDGERLAWARREGVAASFVAADVGRLPFPDDSFDKIVAAEVVEHLADDVAGVGELARVLRPGGRLVVTVPHANYPVAWDPLNKALELFGLPPRTATGGFTGQWSGHERLYLPRQLERVLRRGGLRVDAVEEHTAHTVPFNHVLVYGVGKPLIEHDLLPAGLRRSADRLRTDTSGRRDVVGLAAAALHRYDRRNDRLRGNERRFVQIVAVAVKPGR